MTKLPPADTGACGERRGYQRHRNRGQQACPACLNAWRKPAPEEPDPTPMAQYIIEEIEWQFQLGQSQHQAMVTAGYTNLESLARQLRRHGRPDLARRFEHKKEAA